MALRDNLISWWTLNETSGSRADSHGSNTLNDNNTVGSAVAKKSNGADFVSANSESLSIADASQSGLDISGDFSVSMWVKFDGLSGDQFLFSKGDIASASRDVAYMFGTDGGAGVQLRISDDGSINTSNSLYREKSSVLSTGAWYHIVITFSISTEVVSFYLNGTLQSWTSSTGSVGATLRNSTDRFILGARENSGADSAFFDGLMDEVGIWSRVLTSTEVTELYNSGNGLSYAETAGGTTVSAGVSSSTSSVPTPSLVIDRNVSAGVSSSASSTPTPSVAGKAVVSASVSSGVSSNPTPTISAGGTSVLAGVSSSASSTPTPSIITGTTVTVSISTGVSSVPAPSYAYGVVLTPDAVVGVSSVPTPNIEADFWQDTYGADSDGFWNDTY